MAVLLGTNFIYVFFFIFEPSLFSIFAFFPHLLQRHVTTSELFSVRFLLYGVRGAIMLVKLSCLLDNSWLHAIDAKLCKLTKYVDSHPGFAKTQFILPRNQHFFVVGVNTFWHSVVKYDPRFQIQNTKNFDGRS